MIAVLFEVQIPDDRKHLYLDIAARLRSEVEKIEGFISVERFQSLVNPHKMLSLSFFETEEAVLKWKQHQHHREAQQIGREKIFKDYRICVMQVLRDYKM